MIAKCVILALVLIIGMASAFGPARMNSGPRSMVSYYIIFSSSLIKEELS